MFLRLKIQTKSPASTTMTFLLSFKYKQDMVGNSTVPGFDQGKGNNDDQHVPPVEINQRVWRDLGKEIPRGTARLNVELFTSIKYKTWGIKSKHHKIKYQGAVPIGSDGKIKDKKKKVKLHRSKK
ncbi:PROTEIN NDR1-LIKE [Salix koriyanagi]|uniref:PROTEIN NDR1-LIKE n=1 Tax=Salix koriyanagi TaxID=2511006 RepID=A0A9Q0UXR4_9ROSI|nr:PROTEIN NDR1-LIKE [Salix koriyanagi]